MNDFLFSALVSFWYIMLKKMLGLLMIFCLTVSTLLTVGSTEASAASLKDLGSGWKYRVDPPLSDRGAENDYHVHVKGNKKLLNRLKL